MNFNLSAWAVNHRVLVTFFMILCLIGGAVSYKNLGRQEDPDFSVPTMVIQTNWPGATTEDTMLQITDRIEKKLQEMPHLDYLKSYTKPGISVVYVNILESTDPKQLPWLWYEVRKKLADIKNTLPQGVQGPFFNDEFDDVFGIIYGITYDGFSPRETRDFAEDVRSAFQRNPNVGKVDIFGDQEEKVYLYYSPQKLSALGLQFDQVLEAVAQQNAVTPAGVISTSHEKIQVEVSGALSSTESLEAISFYINNRFYRLSELASIQRGYVDPPSKMFRVNGKPAIGVGVSMSSGGNITQFGSELEKTVESLQATMPVGIDIKLVSNQSDVVEEAIGGFTTALFEAVAIVLAVSFLSLGLRAGLVVALSIPLVLSIVFIGMSFMDVSLQRISLGALIIALGLLVDDAMITVEMMISKIEEGFEKVKAATFAYTSTAFPMLTGTLVTILGFGPIGFAQSNTGQYCFSLFAVIAIALIASWFVAVIFSPVIGLTILPSHMKKAEESEGNSGREEKEGRWILLFEKTLLVCMRHRWLTIGTTVAIFALSLFGQQFVQRQFFPASDRPELLVTLNLPKNSSIFNTEAVVDRVQKELDGDTNLDRYSVNIGGGAIRFYLPLDVQLDNDFLAQFVVVAKGLEERDRLADKLVKVFSDGDYQDVSVRVQRLELGPPVGWPIQYRVSGNTPDEARGLADRVANVLRQSNLAQTINYDWSEKTKTVRVELNQDKVRRSGLSSEALSRALATLFDGQTVTQLRDQTYLINLTARAEGDDRASLENLRSLQLSLPSGGAVPLAELATLNYTLDDTYLWRRDRLPTITVQADVMPGYEAPTIVARIAPQIEEISRSLPIGNSVVVGGAVEKSASSNRYLAAQIPIMGSLMLIVLMFQLQSFSRLLLVISVAPLGLIGVVAAMLLARSPMGFVSTLGIIALVGMIIRNSVILVDQIEHNHGAGMNRWHAVVYAAKHRLRPILLTASAAILGMVPIMRDVFWGPMAFAIIGGLAGATLLTLLFLPALYIAWFRIREDEANESTAPEERAAVKEKMAEA